MDSSPGDALIFREIAAIAAEDRRQLSVWSAAMRGSSQMLRWQSADLGKLVAAAQARAQAACAQAAAARTSARMLRRQDRSVADLR